MVNQLGCGVPQVYSTNISASRDAALRQRDSAFGSRRSAFG
jgi:hypothetical protein